MRRRRRTLKRALLALGILAILAGALVCVAWRQEVGERARPLPSTIPATRSATDVLTSRTDARGVEQVWVPAGWFRCGAGLDADFWVAKADETPQHDVQITCGFWLDAREVTNAAFAEFAADGGYERSEFWSDEGWIWKGSRAGPAPPIEPGFDGAEQPRVWISWYEAEAYARWRGGRLPTEAQWEYAARGRAATIYPWGDEWDDSRARVSDEGLRPTARVGSFPAGRSWCGADDLAGNAWEWTADWYDERYYLRAVRDDPRGPALGTERCTRGGSCGGPPASARTTRRASRDPGQPSHAVGFRVASDGEPPR